MISRFSFILILFLLAGSAVFSQTDSAVQRRRYTQADLAAFRSRDSLRLARIQAWKDSVKAVKDSIKAVRDSLKIAGIKAPDPNAHSVFLDSLIDLYRVRDVNFGAWVKKFPKQVNRHDLGTMRSKGEPWVPAAITVLLLFFAILKNAFSKELRVIIQSFYSNRVLAQISKEDTLFNSWPFIFLYILFGFTIGMFLYLCGKYYQLTYSYTGLQWFFYLSLIVLSLFTLKIIFLRLLGFLFDVQRMVREYVSILYLSYFNAAILFLPLVIAFSLTPFRFALVYIYIAVMLICGIFFFQFLRAGANILSNYRFPKTYLFLYLCALEICPLLILIKALRL
jgi:hypothetical protein